MKNVRETKGKNPCKILKPIFFQEDEVDRWCPYKREEREASQDELFDTPGGR